MSKVLLVLVLVLGAAGAYVATRPDAYHVERSVTSRRLPATVFGASTTCDVEETGRRGTSATRR